MSSRLQAFPRSWPSGTWLPSKVFGPAGTPVPCNCPILGWVSPLFPLTCLPALSMAPLRIRRPLPTSRVTGGPGPWYTLEDPILI